MNLSVGRFVRLSAYVFLTSVTAAAWGAPVLMISIDGLKPEYVTHADEHGLKIPTLRRFLHEGDVCGWGDRGFADGDVSRSHDADYRGVACGAWDSEQPGV